MHEGKRDQAKPLLVALADSTDPEMLNDAAYALADESLDLPLADTASHHSLTLLEDAILAQSGSARDALSRATLLVALWDTIGWVLFREDKLADAEAWLRAAWRNGQDAETGMHLGQVLEKQGKPLDALAVYRLAVSGISGSNKTPVDKALADRIAELRKLPGAAAAEGKSLQEMRTYKLPKAAGLPDAGGTVQFNLMPGGSVQDVRLSGNSTRLDPELSRVPKAKLDLPMPPGARAPLLRHGVLSCHAAPECQLVLVVPGQAIPE